MAEKRRFYWLKLPKEFFQSLRIKKLRRLAGGDTYTIIYLKMLLKSIETKGIFEFKGLEDRFSDEIALDIDEDPENVAVTISYLLKTGLLTETISDDGFTAYELAYSQKMVGSESSSAKRVRDYRAKQEALHCNTSVTQEKRFSNVEKEIEKEIDIKEISSNEDIKKNASDDADILPEEQNVKESFDDINEYVDERPVEKPKPKRKVFKPPTVEEVKAYAAEKGFTRLNAESFVAYYESKGWMIGRNKMKNWKAAASGWEIREKNYNQQSRARPSNFNQFKGREQTEEQARELERQLLGGVT